MPNVAELLRARTARSAFIICRYYGLLAQRFCYLKREYQEVFEDCFRRQYKLIHRLETNKLRNVAKVIATGSQQHTAAQTCNRCCTEHAQSIISTSEIS